MRFATGRHIGHSDSSAGRGIVFGPIVEDHLVDVSHVFADPRDALDLAARPVLDRAIASGAHVAVDELRWLPPVPMPRRILCIGVNYATHRAESDRSAEGEQPVVFTRFASSFVGHGEPIERPPVSDQFDFEGELAVVIGRRARYLSPNDALSAVAGWTCCMDGTLRDFQRHTSQFTPGKNFERSGGIGPWIVTADELPDAADLQLTTTVSGEVMQSASTRDLIHDVADLIAYCSTFTTLEPGDVIATGTPGGVGYARTPPRFLVPDDVVEVTIEHVGTLRNVVIDERDEDERGVSGERRSTTAAR